MDRRTDGWTDKSMVSGRLWNTRLSAHRTSAAIARVYGLTRRLMYHRSFQSLTLQPRRTTLQTPGRVSMIYGKIAFWRYHVIVQRKTVSAIQKSSEAHHWSMNRVINVVLTLSRWISSFELVLSLLTWTSFGVLIVGPCLLRWWNCGWVFFPLFYECYSFC